MLLSLKVYTFYPKRLYFLPKNYILFIQKVYTFHPKSIYFSLKKYILFRQKVYTFFSEKSNVFINN